MVTQIRQMHHGDDNPNEYLPASFLFSADTRHGEDTAANAKKNKMTEVVRFCRAFAGAQDEYLIALLLVASCRLKRLETLASQRRKPHRFEWIQMQNKINRKSVRTASQPTNDNSYIFFCWSRSYLIHDALQCPTNIVGPAIREWISTRSRKIEQNCSRRRGQRPQQRRRRLSHLIYCHFDCTTINPQTNTTGNVASPWSRCSRGFLFRSHSPSLIVSASAGICVTVVFYGRFCLVIFWPFFCVIRLQ